MAATSMVRGDLLQDAPAWQTIDPDEFRQARLYEAIEHGFRGCSSSPGRSRSTRLA